jgi:hypothetical protein
MTAAPEVVDAARAGDESAFAGSSKIAEIPTFGASLFEPFGLPPTM